MRKRTCLICKDLTENFKNPSINGKRFYICKKDNCKKELDKLRNKPLNIKPKIIKQPQKKKQNNIENYIENNIEKKELKKNLYIYGIKEKNLIKFDKVCKKYKLNRTQTFNMIIEFFIKF